MSILGIAAMTGASALANTGASIWSSNRQNRENRELAEYQYAMDRKATLWQAKYNEPIRQKKRLEKAGLNPALMYGSGSPANVAREMPKYQAPKMDYSQIQQGVASSMNMLGNYLSLKKMGAEINYIDANTAARESQTDLIIKQAKKAGLDVTFLENTMENRISKQQGETAAQWQEYENKIIEARGKLKSNRAKELTNKLLREELTREEFENSLLKLNLTKHDDEIIKIIQLLSKFKK